MADNQRHAKEGPKKSLKEEERERRVQTLQRKVGEQGKKVVKDPL